MATTFAPNVKRDAAAAEIVAGAGQWLHITLREQRGAFKAGSRFYGIPSSQQDGRFYLTNLRYCSCPDYEKRGVGCKHQRAALLHVEAMRNATESGAADEAAPTPDHVADPDGSRAYLAKLQAEQIAHATSLLAAGTVPEDDTTYRQRAEHIARLEARHARQDAPKPARRLSLNELMGDD